MSKISAKHMPVRQIAPDFSKSEIDETNSKKLNIAKRSRELTTIADQIANDKLFHKRYMTDSVREKYPFNTHLWFVDKMYPDAKGGRLYVDEPMREWEIQECEEKAKVYKELGLRYVAIKPQMTLLEALEAGGFEV